MEIRSVEISEDPAARCLAIARPERFGRRTSWSIGRDLLQIFGGQIEQGSHYYSSNGAIRATKHQNKTHDETRIALMTLSGKNLLALRAYESVLAIHHKKVKESMDLSSRFLVVPCGRPRALENDLADRAQVKVLQDIPLQAELAVTSDDSFLGVLATGAKALAQAFGTSHGYAERMMATAVDAPSWTMLNQTWEGANWHGKPVDAARYVLQQLELPHD